MKYIVDKQEKYNLIQLEEEKLDSTIAPVLKTEMVTFNAEGVNNIILDLGRVRYVDSSGLSAILVANRLCTNDAGMLVLTNIGDHIMKLIKISQLDSVLNILPTNEEAVDAIFMNEIENTLKGEAEGEIE
jgi:anti-sigma B factor antagonist